MILETIEVRALVVQKSVDPAAGLIASLFPEIGVSGFEVRRTLHKAFQELKDSEFELCLITEGFSDQDLAAFFSDLKAVSRLDELLFVLVKDNFPEGFDRDSVRSAGFQCVIRAQPTDSDKSVLRDELRAFLDRRELTRKCVDVDLAVKLILKEVDSVALDLKRGIKRRFTRNIVADYMSDQVGFHSQVQDSFYLALERYASEAIPELNLKVVLPEDVLSKNLPKLDQDGYHGASSRVYGMLRGKFGVEEGDEQKAEVSEQDLE